MDTLITEVSGHVSMQARGWFVWIRRKDGRYDAVCVVDDFGNLVRVS